MKKICILFVLSLNLFSSNANVHEDYPKIYEQLGTPLFQQLHNFNTLGEKEVFKSHKQNISDFAHKVSLAIQHGKEIDKEQSKDAKKTALYLKELRALQNLHDAIEKSYKKLLYKSIHEKKAKTFYSLTDINLPFLSTDVRLKEKVVQFYTATRQAEKIYSKQYDTSTLEYLSKDFLLDQQSYAYLDTMFQTSQKDQEIEERETLAQFTPDPTHKNPVKVISIRTKNGFDLYLENNAFYDVSIELKAVKLVNLISSKKLPYVDSFPAQSRTKILGLFIQDKHQKSEFQTLYSTTIGRLNPRYDKSYVYALPYARGKAYQLTQGFNGKHTHKDKSAYALDFKMEEGTRVHAMRDGIVVALEEKQTEHGFSPEFTNKSNYIIIQHDDGTMAMYGHLQVNGVHVDIGQRVYKHAFIGLSGNTGYSSGPHLHVHITAIKSLQSGASSIPFTFLSKNGKVDSPVTNAYYLAR